MQRLVVAAFEHRAVVLSFSYNPIDSERIKSVGVPTEISRLQRMCPYQMLIMFRTDYEE